MIVFTVTLHKHSSGKGIDNCFLIWTGSEDSLDAVLKYLNNCNKNMKFTFEKSQHSVHFPDTRVLLENNQLKTDLFCKPIDSHNYLLYSFAHPRKCKEVYIANTYASDKSVVLSQIVVGT